MHGPRGRLALLRRPRRQPSTASRSTARTLDDLAPGRTPDELVRASFAFLLEREPPESIMRSFELPIIGRFFADYPDEIRHRLGTG